MSVKVLMGVVSSTTSSFSIDGVSVVVVVAVTVAAMALFRLFFSLSSAVVLAVVLLMVDRKLFLVLLVGAVE